MSEVRCARASLEKHDLVPPLAEGEKEREKQRADEKPRADLDVRNARLQHGDAAHRPQQEIERYREYVEDDDARAGTIEYAKLIAMKAAATAKNSLPRTHETARSAAMRTTAKGSASAGLRSPAAIGRFFFAGCSPSLARSKTSLRM